MLRAERATTPDVAPTYAPPAGVARPGRRLRVVFVVPAPEFARLILVHDIRQLRAEADVLVATSPGEGLNELRAEDIEVVTIPMNRKIAPLEDVASIARLWRLLRSFRPDIVHSYIPKGGLLGQVAGALAGVPYRIHANRGLVYTVDMSPRARRIVRAGERLTNTLAHRVLYVSRADMEFSVGEGLCPADRAIHTGSGIDLAHFDPSVLPADTRQRVRRELGIPADAPLFLTIGRYVRDKGYREVAQAAARLRRERPDARFVWLAPVMRGETDVLPTALHEELGGTIVRIDTVRDPRPFYLAADALVHPSYREGVPRVVMEAAAMGLPVLASDIPGCREVIRDGVTGRLFPAADADALHGALRQWLAEPDAVRTAAECARDEVRSRFDQDALGVRLLGIYRELTAGRVPRALPSSVAEVG